MSVRILQGDVRERLAELPSDSFDCIVTSPPYWGLRDYGVAGQIGLEPTLTEYLDTMVAVCRELRRVLKPSGTFWLNVGDSYSATIGGTGNNPSGKSTLTTNGGRGTQPGDKYSAAMGTPARRIASGLKHKDLCMVPNRLAIRLQEDGWYVRSEIIWHKPNPMPESVNDRPTSSHEKIWLLTKSGRYAYEADAIKEPANPQERTGRVGYVTPKHGTLADSGVTRLVGGPKSTLNASSGDTRNARNVWTIATQSYSEAHFATFPPELAERCIKAGCPAGGHVLDPFGGAGTTGMVADRLGRDATLIELNSAYVAIIKNRLAEDAGMFAQVAAE
jgi:DNA modification methylase